MEKDLIIHGIRLGQYHFDPEKVLDEIREKCVERGMNYVAFSAGGKLLDKELLMSWVDYMVKNKVYFSFAVIYCDAYGRSPQVESICGFDKETALEIKKKAGEYYLGHVIPEISTTHACFGSEYCPEIKNTHTENLTEAAEEICGRIRRFIDTASFGGEIPVFDIEQTHLITYMNAQGLAFPCLETLVGNPEIMIPFTRAISKAQKTPIWATYIAHEWYGGVRELDPLKMKRLRMVYDYSYMQGSNLFVLESGDECLHAHDTASYNNVEGVKSPFDTIYNYDHPICKQYRDVLDDFAVFVKEDSRPKGGPKVKVAFVQGNLDAYSDWRCGSSFWGCFDNPNFSDSTPEFVWRILNELPNKRNWSDIHNFGEIDLSGAPAYGTYDIINATVGYETFSKYDYLIFTGWNTMTEDIYENLKKFVQGGGRLLMTAAHLNMDDKREGAMKLFRDGDVSDLFGCTLSVEDAFCVNHGYKFLNSIVPEFLYPTDINFDPLFSEGYVNYAKATMTSGVSTGKLSQNFMNPDPDAMPVWLTENKLGDGYAILMTTLDYPGANGYRIFRNVVREILTASHRQADIKVYGGDKLRFTVYDNNKVYLLNTDFDCETHATIDYGNGNKKSFTLKPCELLPVE